MYTRSDGVVTSEAEAGSHAVHHVAGALAHVPDLADVRGADGHPSPGPAMGHGAYQLPPVHARVEGLHRVQVDVAVVPADGEHAAHHRGDPHTSPRRGQLRDVLPA